MKQQLLARLDEVSPIDLTAVIGWLLIAIAIELRLGIDIAIGFIGLGLLLVAFLAAWISRRTTEVES